MNASTIDTDAERGGTGTAAVHTGTATRSTLFAAAAVLTLGVALTACGDGDKPRPAVTVTKTVTAGDAPADSEASDSEPSPESEPDGAAESKDDTLGLTGTAVYENKNEVSLSSFSRGVSGPYASPERTPYVKFTLKLKNGTDKVIDMSALSVLCQYGHEAKDGEQIFDSENGLDGPPQTHLRPGRSITATLGCELPTSQKHLQIEVTPDFETEAAIFSGKVK
ncbi:MULTISPECIES: DUF4352 domain-containing protein [Streptomyces]|uniref:DUF4352 domain-containing protein n=1 Tax=Streptomyces alboflavus TaxID=67267 RepID=A0A1Z1WL32_9ACTN|nr:hypothetical protein [Streptomyces alboflavus]ARX87167.1 hypothetical protein SMD44_06648 [Streptomyces alboflavus]